MKSQKKPVDVVGVVVSGIYGMQRAGQKLWTLGCMFMPWKDADGQVQEGALDVEERNVSERKIARMEKEIRPRDILRLRVRFAGKRVELVKVLGKVKADKDLQPPKKKPPKRTPRKLAVVEKKGQVRKKSRAGKK